MAQLQAQVKRVDRKNRTVELEDGRTIPLPDDLAFELLGSESAKEKKKGTSQSVLDTHKEMSSIPGGEFLSAFTGSVGENSALAKIAVNALDYPVQGISSISSGKGQEGMGFFERAGENILAARSGRGEARQQIAKENPIANSLGAAAGIGADFLLPIKGLKGGQMAQGAQIGGLYGMASDKNLLQDPTGVLKDAATGAAFGGGIGAVGSKLEKVAGDRAALRNYPDLLRQHQAATNKAEKQFLTEMARKLDGVGSDLSGGVARSSVDVDSFINSNIGMSTIAGTPEANRLGNFFSSLIKSAPEHLDANDVKKIFQSVESKLATAAGEEASILNSFKGFLVDALPMGAAQNAVKTKYGQRLFSSFEKDVEKSLNKFLSDSRMVNDVERVIGKNAFQDLIKQTKKSLASEFEKMTPAEFATEIQSGNLSERLMSFFNQSSKFENLENKIQSEIDKIILGAMSNKPIASFRGPEIQSLLKAQNQIQTMKQSLKNNIHKAAGNNRLAASIHERDVLQKVSNKLSDAVGVNNPLTNVSPTNMRPTPTAAPAAPQVGKTAQFLETPNFYSTNMKKMGTMRGGGGLAKMGYLGSLVMGVPAAKVAGTIGAGAAGLGSALRGLTSPTALGAVARQGIQRGSMRLIVESIADRYPSYQNGVLTSPDERRSAVAEIELDPDLGLEDKAVLQAKINRGQSIERLIKE